MSHLAAMHVDPENPSAIHDTINEIQTLHSTKQQIRKYTAAVKSGRTKKTYQEEIIIVI